MWSMKSYILTKSIFKRDDDDDDEQRRRRSNAIDKKNTKRAFYSFSVVIFRSAFGNFRFKLLCQPLHHNPNTVTVSPTNHMLMPHRHKSGVKRRQALNPTPTQRTAVINFSLPFIRHTRVQPVPTPTRERSTRAGGTEQMVKEGEQGGARREVGEGVCFSLWLCLINLSIQGKKIVDELSLEILAGSCLRVVVFCPDYTHDDYGVDYEGSTRQLLVLLLYTVSVVVVGLLFFFFFFVCVWYFNTFDCSCCYSCSGSSSPTAITTTTSST